MKKVSLWIIVFSLFISTAAFAGDCLNCGSYIIFRICDCVKAPALQCGEPCDETNPATCEDGSEIGIRLRILTKGVYWAPRELQDASILSITQDKFVCGDCLGGPVGNRTYGPGKDGYYRWTQWTFTNEAGDTLTEATVTSSEDYDYEYVTCNVPYAARFTEVNTADSSGEYAGYQVDCDDSGYWAINLPAVTMDWEESRDSVGETARVRVMLFEIESDQLCQDCSVVCDCVVDLFTVSDTAPLEVTTASATSVTATTALCGGNIKMACSPGMRARGVCWSTSRNPTVLDDHTEEETGFGSFSTTLQDLEPNTTYYVRAYATNSLGTSYGNEITFTTQCPDDLTAYIPHITPLESEWMDYLQVDNQGDKEACFRIVLYNQVTMPYTYGDVVYSEVHSVPALGRHIIDLKSLSSGARCGKILYGSPDLFFRLSFDNLGGNGQTGGGLAEYKLTDSLLSTMSLYFSDYASALKIKGAAITNMGFYKTDVTLDAMGGGKVLGSYTTTLEPYGKLVGPYTDWFPDIPFAQMERIIATSTNPTLCGIVNNSDATLANLVTTIGQPEGGDAATLFYIPHLTSDYPDWNDTLQIDSSNSADTIVTLFLYGEGKIVFNRTYAVPKMGKLKINLKSLSSKAECGMLSSRGPGLFCRLSFENIGGASHKGGGLSEFKLTGELTDLIRFNFSDFSPRLVIKAAAVANMTEQPVDVTLKAIGGGTVLGTYPTTINGRDKLHGSYADWFPEIPFADIDRMEVQAGEKALTGIVQNADAEISTLVFTAAEPAAAGE